MDNIVDLEQLDYRDRLIKEYIDNLPKGGGSQLFCELEVDTIYTEIAGEPDEAHLYIKCYKGTILESDELQFARNTATPTWHYTGETNGFGVPVKVLVKKRRGWIIPKPYNLVRLYKVYAEEKSAASELYDYWEVLPKNRQGAEVTWQELLDEFLQKRLTARENKGLQYSNSNWIFTGDSYVNNYASFVNRWAGVAVKRDGKLISDYMLWQISGPRYGNTKEPRTFQSGSFVSTIAANGIYFTTANDNCFYHFSLKH